MSRIRILIVVLLFAICASPLAAHYWLSKTGEEMTIKAQKFVATLSAEQQAKALLSYENPKRLDWHFIPKNDRKGVQLRDMSDDQRAAAHDLLKSCLSEIGYDKATKIMELEQLLHELETRRKANVNVRDSLRYYFTLFGAPAADQKWGLSIEGHHLSLNFVVEKGEVVSSTPTVFCTNPAIVKTDILPAVPQGRRVLAKEETLAFDLLATLTEEQQTAAVLADVAPKEVRTPGSPQPPTEAAVGLSAGKMDEKQQQLLHQLIDTYCESVPADVAAARQAAIKEAGFDQVYFCWMGARKPGVGHYYRLQGPSFVVELVNTQPDAEGNPANHVHCLWRDMAGDFALPIK